MARREVEYIASGIGVTFTGDQTLIKQVPRWARSAVIQLSVTAMAGTAETVDFVLRHATRKATAAIAVATTQAGGGGNDEVQTVTLTGGPTGGLWGLSWGGVSANISASTGRVFAPDASAGEVQDRLNAAIRAATSAALGYGKGTPVAVSRAGAGTSGSPYVYTCTFSGTGVANTNVDAMTADGTRLFEVVNTGDDFMGWNGITQLAVADDVTVVVTPGLATDDVGPVYVVQGELPEYLVYVLTLGGSTDETYTYSIYATYIG